MGGWGSRVLNFLVKIHIQLFVLQTSSNVLKQKSHKVRRSYLVISGCFDAQRFILFKFLGHFPKMGWVRVRKILCSKQLKKQIKHNFSYFWSPKQ